MSLLLKMFLCWSPLRLQVVRLMCLRCNRSSKVFAEVVELVDTLP